MARVHFPTFISALGFHTRRRVRGYIAVLAVFLVIVGFVFLLPPFGFPTSEVITVEEDASFAETAQMLEERDVVRSAFILRAVARISQADREIQAGQYMFSEPVGLSMVLFRLVHGVSGLPTARLTFPEGIPAREMGDILASEIPGFDRDAFISYARPHEGMLFPDTYDFYFTITPQQVVARLQANFETKYQDVAAEVEAFGKTQGEILTMASLLEKEAKTMEDRRVIAGILWKRIDLGMPLQVDAVFGYIHDRSTYHPSFEDLESDSPYNTYKNQGLPPGPIGNPGLDAINAASTPLETEYLYYLTGTDGQMRYARTFEEHKENRELYVE